jgi:hypothetical protein
MQGKKGTPHGCTHLKKWGHVYNVILLLRVFDFLGESFYFSQNIFGRTSRRFVF